MILWFVRVCVFNTFLIITVCCLLFLAVFLTFLKSKLIYLINDRYIDIDFDGVTVYDK